MVIVWCSQRKTVKDMNSGVHPMTHIPPFPPHSFLFPSISISPPLPLPSPTLPSLRSRHPLIQLGVWESAVSSPSGSERSPAAKRYLVHLELKNASGESNFKCTFTSNENMFVFRCYFVIITSIQAIIIKGS